MCRPRGGVGGVGARVCLPAGLLGQLFYGQLAAVIATFTTYHVIDVPCAAVGADGQCGGYCFVVGAAFRCTGVRLSAFRMCHFMFFCFVLLMS